MNACLFLNPNGNYHNTSDGCLFPVFHEKRFWPGDKLTCSETDKFWQREGNLALFQKKDINKRFDLLSDNSFIFSKLFKSLLKLPLYNATIGFPC